MEACIHSTRTLIRVARKQHCFARLRRVSHGRFGTYAALTNCALGATSHFRAGDCLGKSLDAQGGLA